MVKMNHAKYIVTHAGPATRDELITCCIALALNENCTGIYRRDPTTEEKMATDVILIDVGGEHDPSRLNFDHHQFDKDAKPECSLSLYLHWVGLEEAFQYQPWYRNTVLMDSKGPQYLAEQLGIPEIFYALESPIERHLLYAFELEGKIEGAPKNWLWDTLVVLGKLFTRHASAYAERMVYLHSNIQTNRVGTIPALILHESSTLGMEDYKNIHEPEAGFAIAYDHDGPGWKVARLSNDKRIDLAKLKDDPKVMLAHPDGRLLKTKDRLNIPELLDLLEGALISPRRSKS